MSEGPPARRGQRLDRRGAGSSVLSGLGWPVADAPSRFAAMRAMLAVLLEHEGERRTGFLWLPVAMGLGILLYFVAEQEPWRWAAPLVCLAALVPVVIAGERRGGAQAPRLSLALAFAALGFSAAGFRTASVQAPMIERLQIVEIAGYIEAVDHSRARQRLVLRPTAIEGMSAAALPYRIRIGVAGGKSPQAGAHVVLRARLQPPAEAALPGGYDFRRDAYFRSVGAVGFVLGRIEARATTAPAPLDLRFNAMIDRWRNALTTRIADTIGGEAGALSAALITGKRGLIGEATNDALRASGLYHIVSISGLHMVLAAGVLFWLSRAAMAAIPAVALRHPIKKYAAVFAMLGAVFYCVFSGSEVATERSLIMTLVMLGAILFDRPALAMRNLALSALIVMLIEPEAILGPSFQMSYAAVAGLIAANRVWQDWRAGRDIVQRGPAGRAAIKLALAFGGMAATTIIATIATAPFAAFHFHRLNPLGLIGNSLAIPLVSFVVMPAAVAGTLLVPFGLDGFVWRLMGVGSEGVLFVAERVAALDYAVVAAPHKGGLPFALLIIGFLLIFCLQTRLRWLSILPLSLALLVFRAMPLPDLIVDPSGQMALIRGEGGVYRLLATNAGNRFVLGQWLPFIGDARQPGDASLKADTRCDSSGCTGRLADGRLVALSLRNTGLREDCQRADIIITPLPAAQICKAQKRVFDRAHFERFGATLVMRAAPEDWRLETALDPRRHRPWRKHSPTPPQIAAAPDGEAIKDSEAIHLEPAVSGR